MNFPVSALVPPGIERPLGGLPYDGVSVFAGIHDAGSQAQLALSLDPGQQAALQPRIGLEKSIGKNLFQIGGKKEHAPPDLGLFFWRLLGEDGHDGLSEFSLHQRINQFDGVLAKHGLVPDVGQVRRVGVGTRQEQSQSPEDPFNPPVDAFSDRLLQQPAGASLAIAAQQQLQIDQLIMLPGPDLKDGKKEIRLKHELSLTADLVEALEGRKATTESCR